MERYDSKSKENTGSRYSRFARTALVGLVAGVTLLGGGCATQKPVEKTWEEFNRPKPCRENDSSSKRSQEMSETREENPATDTYQALGELSPSTDMLLRSVVYETAQEYLDN